MCVNILQVIQNRNLGESGKFIELPGLEHPWVIIKRNFKKL